jgi:urease accessory protein
VAETTLHVGPGATLWWLPGELIPFHDANLLARTMIRLDEGARIALLEIVTPGRTAMDERFAYRRLDLRLRIDSCGKPLFVERAVLDPQSRPAARVGSLGPFCCSGTLILAGYDNVPAISRYDDDLWLAAGGGNGLALVRGIGRAAAPLRAALLDVLRQAAASAGSGAHAGGAGVKA